MKNGLHLVLDLFACGKLVKREKVLLKIEVEVWLKVAESNWIFKDIVFKFSNIRFALNKDVLVEVLDYVI